MNRVVLGDDVALGKAILLNIYLFKKKKKSGLIIIKSFA